MAGDRTDQRALASYFADISSLALLSAEEEARLSRRIQQGDLQARDTLVQANLRFVVRIAKSYQNCGLDFAELIAIGNMGLLRAAERFEGKKGYRFTTYAVWWIRQAILQALAEQTGVARLPSNRHALANALRKAARSLQTPQEAPALDELADRFEVSDQDVRKVADFLRAPLSLDRPVGEDDERSPHEQVADPGQEAADEAAEQRSTRALLDRVLDSLGERERQILQQHYGLTGAREETLEEISTAMGLSRERVRQIKERALAKLRSSAHTRTLRSLLTNA